MRLDKFLKVSRLIKRRTIAKEACDSGRVSVNGKVVKPGFELKIDDIIEISFANRLVKARVLSLQETVKKAESTSMYELIEGKEIE